MKIKERLYRAVRERELKGVSSKKPEELDGIYDYKYYLDAMYSHEIPSHTLHKNEFFYSWTSDLSIAKQFLAGTKGTGGYVAIAYIDIFFDIEKGLPIDLSAEIPFAYPLFKRENWIDMLILRELYSENKNSDYIELKNMNYNTKKAPYFLSNLLTVRNGAFSLASKTREYVLILRNARLTLINNLDMYMEPKRDNNLSYTGITPWLLKHAAKDYELKKAIKRVIALLKSDIDCYKKNSVISNADYKEINRIVHIYKNVVA